MQRARLRKNWDLMFAVVGPVGTGKSTLGFHLQAAIDPGFLRVVDGEVELPRVCFSTAEVLACAKPPKQAPRYSAILLDEATDGAMGDEWYTEEAKGFKRYGITARKLNYSLGICVPDLDLLLKWFRDSRLEWVFHVDRRGHAVAYFGRKGVWSRKMYRHRQFELTFPPLHPRIEGRYLEIAEAWARESGPDRREGAELEAEDGELDPPAEWVEGVRRVVRGVRGGP